MNQKMLGQFQLFPAGISGDRILLEIIGNLGHWIEVAVSNGQFAIFVSFDIYVAHSCAVENR